MHQPECVSWDVVHRRGVSRDKPEVRADGVGAVETVGGRGGWRIRRVAGNGKNGCRARVDDPCTVGIGDEQAKLVKAEGRVSG